MASARDGSFDSRLSGHWALLACDLDGTLLTSGGRPADGVPAALRALVGSGLELVVCTGRALQDARRLAGPLTVLPGAYVCYHGAVVVDEIKGQQLLSVTIPTALAREVIRDAILNGLGVTAYVGDERREIAGPLDSCDAATRLILSGDDTTRESVGPAIVARWRDRLRIEPGGRGVLDVLPCGVDKGTALGVLARSRSVDAERIVAFGDAESDIPLLLAAGRRVAVGDPPSGLREVADEVVPQRELADFLLTLLE
jgi:hypothetical protein